MLLQGYVQEGKNHEALNCFGSMQGEGIYPNAATFVFYWKHCCRYVCQMWAGLICLMRSCEVMQNEGDHPNVAI